MNTASALGRPGALLLAYVAFLTLFLLAPLIIAIVLSFSAANTLAFPPPGVSMKWFVAAIENATFRSGLLTSIGIALGASVLAGIAGTAAAVAFQRYTLGYSPVVRAIVMLPLTLPGIVLGLGILFVLPLYGMKPGPLATMLGHAVLGIPYVTYMVLAAFANYDMALEQASLNLGASRAATFRRITLPLIAPGIAAGMFVAFMTSFDNFALSLFIAKGDTLPLRLFQHIQFYLDPTVAAVATLLVVFAGLVALTATAIVRAGSGQRWSA